MFRNEDYLPPKDDESKQALAPDDLEVLETALVSVCPRCGKVCTIRSVYKYMTLYKNYKSCRSGLGLVGRVLKLSLVD